MSSFLVVVLNLEQDSVEVSYFDSLSDAEGYLAHVRSDSVEASLYTKLEV